MRLKTVFRWDGGNRLFRVARLIWRRGQGPGHGYPRNYDASLSLAFCPPWWLGFRRETEGWRLWFAGCRIHRDTSWGGCIV